MQKQSDSSETCNRTGAWGIIRHRHLGMISLILDATLDILGADFVLAYAWSGWQWFQLELWRRTINADCLWQSAHFQHSQMFILENKTMVDYLINKKSKLYLNADNHHTKSSVSFNCKLQPIDNAKRGAGVHWQNGSEINDELFVVRESRCVLLQLFRQTLNDPILILRASLESCTQLGV